MVTVPKPPHDPEQRRESRSSFIIVKAGIIDKAGSVFANSTGMARAVLLTQQFNPAIKRMIITG
ncbi:hypothetical protein TERTU_4045 [Teredinibacter turnerae T7901]|uniref:Uncharacterized protein n=1 Tax=Teredinibacter turnerae (strain ATCC 39867 / T7901) TaxID=377629 RepID=C5BTW8_TERTT|nr:hypothetical protein [Teredinibacter turnerae]ACR13551.1 hypothetical protein TERTU_4045 [Teredinibacter turnerae T7901]